jgi:hypothetical protein
MIGAKSMCAVKDFAFFCAGMIEIADWPHTQQQKKGNSPLKQCAILS